MKKLLWSFGTLGFLLGGYYAIWQAQILDRGFSVADLGILLAIRTTVSLLVDLPTGVLADRIGQKRTTIIGFFFYFVAFIPPILSFNPLALAATVIIMGVGDAFVSGAMDSWAAHVQKETDRTLSTKKFATRDQIQRIGMIAGALALPACFSFMAGTSVSAWVWYLVAAGFLLIVSLTSPADKMKHSSHAAVPSWRTVLKSPGMLLIVSGSFFFGLGDGGVELTFWPKIKELGVSDAALFGVIQMSMSVARIVGLELWKRTHLIEKSITPGLSVIASSLFFFAFAWVDHPQLAVALWLARIGVLCVYFSSLNALLMRLHLDKQQSATAISMVGVVGALGRIAFTGSAGFLGLSNLGWLIGIAAVLMFIAGLHFIFATARAESR